MLARDVGPRLASWEMLSEAAIVCVCVGVWVCVCVAAVDSKEEAQDLCGWRGGGVVWAGANTRARTNEEVQHCM